jgi:hypothetical protein
MVVRAVLVVKEELERPAPQEQHVRDLWLMDKFL